MTYVSQTMKKSESCFELVHVACNEKHNSITNGFYEYFETNLLRNKKSGVEGLKSRTRRIDLQAGKFTRFLNKKKSNRDQKENKENVSESNLVMMAKSEKEKACLEQEVKDSHNGHEIIGSRAEVPRRWSSERSEKAPENCLGALFGALSATFPEEPHLLALRVKLSTNFSIAARSSALSGALSTIEMGLGFVSVVIPLYLKDPDALGFVSLAKEVQQHTLPLFEGGFGCGSFHLQLLGKEFKLTKGWKSIKKGDEVALSATLGALSAIVSCLTLGCPFLEPSAQDVPSSCSGALFRATERNFVKTHHACLPSQLTLSANFDPHTAESHKWGLER
ncbi:hypothetical protein LR48_Vigan02g094200 [Vigna angularis]|uniref:Uncharacterized protein n=1 Tax=Phaseolus angularis TaxID=3914 RepID=A0A0L9TWJ5_PHAAN|nr:hypothetical protein LR48_Vigan02g094200 [Vigna angularis]